MISFEVNAKLWKYQGKGAWFFVTIPKSVAADIKSFEVMKRGWGSVRVRVMIGKSEWETSIFPEKEGTYLLPIKKEIREREKLEEGQQLTVRIILRDV